MHLKKLSAKWHPFCVSLNVLRVPHCNRDTMAPNLAVKWVNSSALTHWGRVTHICLSKLTIIGSDNGLSPGRGQAIIGTNAGLLLIGPLGRNFSEIVIEIQRISFKKMHLKMSSGKWRPFYLGLNVLTMDLLQSCTQPMILHDRNIRSDGTIVSYDHISGI